MKNDTAEKKVLFIYNPHAGKKRKTLSAGEEMTIDGIKALLQQYEIAVDYAPTKAPNHATELAAAASKAGYDTVLVAGGDGTINEAANGLVGTDITLGIIPMGTFMNIAKMLSIPLDIEKAILLIKLGRVRKIDVGEVTKFEGETLSKPFYFLESSGIGLDAHIQEQVKEIEKGNVASFFHLIYELCNFAPKLTEIVTDEKTITCNASLINVANGPYGGANLKISPAAKLNDHSLTVSIYPMSRFELIKYFFRMKRAEKHDMRRIQVIKTKTVKVLSESPDMKVHIDASMFGVPPVSYRVKPSVLKVICGYPIDKQNESFKGRAK